MFSLLNKKKKSELSQKETNIDRLWDKWETGELEEINYDLFVVCEYQAGVNGEGHSGFFFNNEEKMSKYSEVLSVLLPDDLYQNFLKAYKSFNTDSEEIVCEQADSYFYDHEQVINDYLQANADAIG